MARRSVAITTGTSVDRRRSAPNSQKDCLLSYIASILQGPSGSAGACWASTPHAKAAYIPLRGGGFDRYMGHYVFMHFAPSFLPSRAARVTRITESSHRRERLVSCTRVRTIQHPYFLYSILDACISKTSMPSFARYSCNTPHMRDTSPHTDTSVRGPAVT